MTLAIKNIGKNSAFMLLASLLAISVLSIYSFLVYLRPIIKLSDEINKMRNGPSGIQSITPSPREDEAGIVTNEFIKTTELLKKQINEKNKTQNELEKHLQLLEKNNRLMIGREQRMQELKKKIADLEKNRSK